MKKTEWNCEACGATGTIEHDEHAGIYAVVNQLRDDHETVSPKCDSGVAKMRVKEIS